MRAVKIEQPEPSCAAVAQTVPLASHALLINLKAVLDRQKGKQQLYPNVGVQAAKSCHVFEPFRLRLSNILPYLWVPQRDPMDRTWFLRLPGKATLASDLPTLALRCLGFFVLRASKQTGATLSQICPK